MATLENRKAARKAVQRLEAMLVEMMENGEVGEAAVVVTPGDLTPEKRVTKKARSVKIAVGYSTLEHA